MKKTIGILGGMGPEATAYFFNLIVKLTDAATDQEHIPIVIYNDPRIPPRTDALLGLGQSPKRRLREGVRRLEKAGASFIVIPCITAHAFLPAMREVAGIPILDVPRETAAWAKAHFPALRVAGLLASTGTIRSGLFHTAFSRVGIDILTPREPEQEKVMSAIFGPEGIKAGFTTGRPRKLILSVARHLVRRGAGAIITGCTEVPLVLTGEDIPVPLIEPLEVAARLSIARAGYRVRAKGRPGVKGEGLG